MRSLGTAIAGFAALFVAAGLCHAQTTATAIPSKAPAAALSKAVAQPAKPAPAAPAAAQPARPAPAAPAAEAAKSTPAAPETPGVAAGSIGIVPALPLSGELPGIDVVNGTGEFELDVKKIRNPFKPFVAIQQKSGKAGAKKKTDLSLAPRTPLQKFALEDLKFVGVVWSKTSLKGLIEDPTGKGYTVGPGTLVGDRGGKIVKIHPDRMMVEEYGVDVLGEESVREITIQLHKTENEVNP